MKALITGGTGFLGINLIKQLRELDWQVVVLHRSTSNLEDLKDLGVEFLEASLSDREQLLVTIPSDLDAIFHLAGDTNMWKKNNARQYDANVLASRNIAEVAAVKESKTLYSYFFHISVWFPL